MARLSLDSEYHELSQFLGEQRSKYDELRCASTARFGSRTGAEARIARR